MNTPIPQYHSLNEGTREKSIAYGVIDAWKISSYSTNRAGYFLVSIIYMFSKLETIIYQYTQKFNFFNNFDTLTLVRVYSFHETADSMKLYEALSHCDRKRDSD